MLNRENTFRSYGWEDFTGKKLGRLTVIRYIGADGRYPSGGLRHKWLVRCDCSPEKEKIIAHKDLGVSRSCGCLQRECAKRTGMLNTTHGRRYAVEYRAWVNMKSRCYDPRQPHYADYGGRGIGVCERWLEAFENFYEDMGPRPTPDHSIDRIEVNGNYEPSNCRWATRKRQQRNRRGAVMLTFRGSTKCLNDWADELGILSGTIRNRLFTGWSVERALSTPSRKQLQAPEYVI